jgi:hypothetical protein
MLPNDADSRRDDVVCPIDELTRVRLVTRMFRQDDAAALPAGECLVPATMRA